MNDFEPSPLSRILELGQKADLTKVTSNCSYLMLFKNNPLPTIPQSSISLLRENYQSKEKICEILYNMDFVFPVITQSLTEISQNLEKMSQNNQIYASIFLLYSFFAWYMNYTKTGRIYPADVVLASLMKIKVDNSFEILAKSSFYFGFKALIESPSNPLFDKYLPTMRTFFLSEDTLPTISGELIMLILTHFTFSKEETSLDPDLSEILKIIIETTALHQSIFTEEVVLSIIAFLTPYWNLNYDKESILLVIRCFSSILEFHSSENYSKLISTTIVPVLLGLICTDTDEKIEQSLVSSDVNALPNNIEIIQDFTFPKRSTFSNGLKNQSLKTIYVENDCHYRFGSFYHDFFCLIKALNKSFDNMNAFVSLISDRYNEIRHTKNSQHISLFLLFLLYVINEKEGTEKRSKIINAILHILTDSSDELFDPNITIFNHDFPDDQFNREAEVNPLLELNSIRNEYLKNIIEKNNTLHNFLSTTRTYPNLMTEIIYRLTSIPVQIPIIFLDELMNYYRFMDIANFNSDLVEITRESLFIYISKVYSNCLLDDTTVITSYFLCLMEDNLAEMMSKLLVNYFTNISKTVNIESFVVFLRFIKMNSINDKTNIQKLITRVIQLLRSIFVVKIAFSRDFRRVYDEIFQIVSQIEITNELMNLLLELFIFISPEYEINEINAFLLEKALLNNFDEALFDNLLKLISVDNLHIYNSRMISITYNLFATKKFNEFIMNFLYKNLLIDSIYSLENCKKCFHANFDCFLLDKLNEIKTSDYTKENEEKMKNLLLVYEQISNYFSSPSAILKFVSLLTPKQSKDGKFCLSRYMPCFMNSLYKLVDNDYSIKVDHLTFNSCTTFSDEFNLPSSFTICFWIKCKESKDNEINIFKTVSLNDKQESIRIFMKSNVLNVSMGEFHFSKEMSFHTWNFISISIHENQINVMINLIKAIFTNISPFPENLSLQGTIGDAESKNCFELGLFAVLNLQDSEELKVLFHNGVFSSVTDPIFTFSNCYDSSSNLDLKTSTIMSSTVAFKRIVYNFVFCLADLWKCDVLFPLLSISDLPFEKVNDEHLEKSEYYDELPYLTTEILTKCLTLNPKLQNYFIESNKIPIISYLLLHHKKSQLNIINLKLYQKFNEMYMSVSNRELHAQIYFSLLTNILLVQKTNQSDHAAILGKWLSNVSLLPKAYKRRSFSVLLSLLNLFYKYKAINSLQLNENEKNNINVNSNSKESNEININDNKLDGDSNNIDQEAIDVLNSQIRSRRQILHSLLTLSVNTTFSMDDFKELINQCVYQYQKYVNSQKTSKNRLVTDRIEMCLDLLRLMKMLVVQTPSTFKEMGLQVTDIFSLHQIITGNEKFAIHFIETILIFYYQGIFSKDMNLAVHFGLIINMLATMKLTENFLTCLINHANRSVPEIFVFCCWYLSVHETRNEELQNFFISSLSTIFFPLTKDQMSNSFFLFWAVSLSNILATQRQQRILFAFIIKILYDEWYRALPAIAAFSEAPDAAIMEYIELVLLLNSDVELIEEEDLKPFKIKSFSPNDFDLYFSYAILFIVMRPQKRKMTNLEKMFVQSPFMEDHYEIIQSENDQINNSKKGYYNDKEGLFFGLRFDDDMQWIDLDFAEKLFNQRKKLILSDNYTSNNQKCVQSFSVLLKYISHEDPNFLVEIEHDDEQLSEQQKNAIYASLSDDILSPDSFGEIYDEAFIFVDEIKTEFIQSYKKFQTEFKLISTKVDDMFISLQEYRNKCNENKSNEKSMLTQVKRILSLNQNESKYQWNSLLRNLTIEKGPWGPESLSTSPSSFYFSRSLTLCSNLCPFLMKRKYSKNHKTIHSFNFFHKYDFHFWTLDKFYPNALPNNTPKQQISNKSFTSILNNISTINDALENGSHDNPQLLVFDCQLQRIDGIKLAKLKIDSNSISIFILNTMGNFEESYNINSIQSVIKIDKNDISILITKRINDKLLKLEIYTISNSRSYLLISEYVSEIVDAINSICQPQPNRTVIIKLSKNQSEQDSSKNDDQTSVTIVNIRAETLSKQPSIPIQTESQNQGQTSLQTLVSNVQQRWGLGKCTNFDYLMFLNVFSGRSFNDLSQYPIFPWILSDFSSPNFKINDESIFRDFSSPIGKNGQIGTSLGILPPQKVVSYLSRISPFDKLEVSLMDKLPPIQGIQQQYNEEASQNSASSAELTPEFFYMPEFLIDSNNANVILPKWAQNPLDFIYKHRKLLESDYVSSHLNEWIDLVFGCKQQKTLTNQDESIVKDIFDRKGQIACQLFSSPHLRRSEIKSQIRRKKLPPSRSVSQPSFDKFSDDTNEEGILKKKLVVPLFNENQKAEGNIPINKELLLAFFKADSLYAFDSSLNVIKYQFDFDKQELRLSEKRPLFTQDSNNSEYLTKISQILKQNKKSVTVRCLNDVSNFYIFDIDSTISSQLPSPLNISMQVFNLDAISPQEASSTKIECVDGQFIVVSNSLELSLLIMEIIEPPKQPKRIISRRYMQFRAVPKCCAISSIFKTFVVASDDNSLQIASLAHNYKSSSWKLSHIIDLNKDSSFVPMNVLITDGFGFIVLYGKMKMSLDENESFIYVFTINGVFIRSQKIDGEVVNWTKWRGQKGFDFLALVIKKKSGNDDITYKIAICEAYYLNLDILNFRISKKIVSLEFLYDRNALAVFQSDGNFMLISYTPDELYVE